MSSKITIITSSAFIGFILHSMWTLSSLFAVPSCKESDQCLMYYLNRQPKLQLAVFSSEVAKKERNLIEVIKHFDYNEPFQRNLKLEIPASTRNNGTMYLHFLLLPEKYEIKKWDDALKAVDLVYKKSLITEYHLPLSGTYQLLRGSKSSDPLRTVTHLKTSLTFNILVGLESLPRINVPNELIEHMKFKSNTEFLPIFFNNFLHDRLKHLVEVNANSSTMNVTLNYEPIGIGKLRLMLHIGSSFSNLKMYGFNDKDFDEVKGIFADTNLYLLCITIFISSIHLLFDMLAIKNDVSFWRSRRSMEGLSGKTVIWRAFSQIVIFFYLLDENTSLLVLIPAFLSTLIEVWKVQKVVPFDFKEMKFKKVKLSENEKKTQEFDAECMRYLAYLLYPLCFGAAVYSLLYETHRSWYSWCIHSLVNGVYAFGFLFMLPQLFINYRLKSVAHLPWRAFTYKAFNTFIDDIFAFIITMPTAHRLACFRDDVIFIVYLYQRWLYPVDKSRIDDSLSMDEDVGTVDDYKKKE